MRRIILCEGRTDVSLIGLYLEKITKWKFKKPKAPIINLSQNIPLGDEFVTHYYQEGNLQDVLLICSVGGKDRFKLFFETYLFPMIKTINNKETEYRIAIVTDADNRGVKEIEEDILSQLSKCIQTLSNNVWKLNKFKGDFDVDVSIDCLLTIIPQDKTGALETVLLDSLSEIAEGETVVSHSINFIDNLPYISYISKDRLKLKSKLGVVLSVIYPDKVFDQFDMQFKLFDWSKSKTLANCFSELIKI